MNPLTMKLVTGFVVLFLVQQFAVGREQTRADEIEAARDKKAQHLQADKVTGAEAVLRYIKDNKIMERIAAGISGFRLKLGGLVTGSGFALGPEYLRRDLADGEIVFRVAAQSSFKSYQKYDLQFTLPSLANDRLFFEFYSVHHRYPSLKYYGPGPDSREESGTDFLYEDTALDAAFGVKPFRYMNLGVSGGYLFLNVGPGQDETSVSTEQIFTPEQTPGIDRQSDFLRFGTFASIDYSDNPGGPRNGGRYSLQFSNYSDRTLDSHDFRRLDIDLQQYVPFFNKRRVIALRFKSVLTFHDEDQTVPFYLQPVLGGSNDLRGYRPFRYYDDNMIVANMEYRWETFSGLDSAIFWDVGKVFSDHSQWNFDHMKSSVGFGLRFNVLNNVFLRIDTGFSRDGTQIWFKFGDIFAGGPVRYSSPY